MLTVRRSHVHCCMMVEPRYMSQKIPCSFPKIKTFAAGGKVISQLGNAKCVTDLALMVAQTPFISKAHVKGNNKLVTIFIAQHLLSLENFFFGRSSLQTQHFSTLSNHRAKGLFKTYKQLD